MPGSLVAACAVLLAINYALQQYRNEVEARVLLASQNLSLAIEAQLAHQLANYADVLRLVSADIDDPAFASLAAASRQRLLGDIRASTGRVETIIVIDANGTPVVTQPVLPWAVQQATRIAAEIEPGQSRSDFVVSDPIADGSGQYFLMISRPVWRRDGSWGGTAALLVNLQFLRDILQQRLIGPGDTLALLSNRGVVVMRRPTLSGVGDTGIDVSKSANFQRMVQRGTGSFTAVSGLDGTQRLVTFLPVRGTHFIVGVGVATAPIYAGWNRHALIIGGLALLISIVLIMAASLLRRELRLRSSIEEELQRQAMTDYLTGLANRRQFEVLLARDWRRAARTGGILSLMVLDADHFKKVNDAHGHAVGDEMLRVIARVISAHARHLEDTTARIGGEEFAVLLPELDADAARAVAERIRADLRETMLPIRGGIPAVSVSVGIATTLGADVTSSAALLELADSAVYRAKENGRNRVAHADRTDPELAGAWHHALQ